MARLEAYLAPARNPIADRMGLQRICQKPDEPFDGFLARLRLAAGRCGFGAEQLAVAVRDQAIAGCRPPLQEKLLHRAAEKGDGFSLQDVIALAYTAEQTAKLVEDMRRSRLPED